MRYKDLYVFHVFFMVVFLVAFVGKINAEDNSTNSFVLDKEDLFTIEQEGKLNTLINNYMKRTNNEIDIITVSSFAPFNSLYEYSVDLSNNWTSLMDSKNVLLVVLSKSLGGVYVLTAYGTEKLIRNDVCRRIIDSEMLPFYSKYDFYNGTERGLKQLMKEWN